jgi:hypothetical protein
MTGRCTSGRAAHRAVFVRMPDGSERGSEVITGLCVRDKMQEGQNAGAPYRVVLLAGIERR